MAYECDRPEFTVTVTSDFTSSWKWAVHAKLEYRSFGASGRRAETEAEAKLQLMIGISRECRRGRERGARIVVVDVEGDAETAGFFQELRKERDVPRLRGGGRQPTNRGNTTDVGTAQ